MDRELNLWEKAWLEETERQRKENSEMIDELNIRILKAIEEAREGNERIIKEIEEVREGGCF